MINYMSLPQLTKILSDSVPVVPLIICAQICNTNDAQQVQ